MAVHGYIEVARFADLHNKLIHHRPAVLALIFLHAGDDAFSIVIDAFDLQNHAAVVVFHLDFRIYTQKKRSRSLLWKAAFRIRQEASVPKLLKP